MWEDESLLIVVIAAALLWAPAAAVMAVAWLALPVAGPPVEAAVAMMEAAVTMMGDQGDRCVARRRGRKGACLHRAGCQGNHRQRHQTKCKAFHLSFSLV